MSSQRETPNTDPAPAVEEQEKAASTELAITHLPLDPLFDEAYGQFQKLPKEDFELFIPPSTDSAEIRLLFEEVYRNLTPRKRSAFEQKKILTSEERKLESATLAEKALHTAKIVKIKEAEREKRAQKARSLRKEMLADQQVLLMPGLMDRLGAALIDSTGVITATMMASVPLALLLYPLDLFALLTGTPMPSTTLLLSGLVLGLLPFVIIVYHAFWTIHSGGTPGLRFGNLVLVDMKNNRPHITNLVIRATLMPLSLLCFGFLTPILGIRSIADLISGTRTIQEYSSIEDEGDEEHSK
jgi:uncharacterized RDD family membrane protein YckC